MKVGAGEAQVEVVMSAGTFIRGRVLDEYGRPAPRISVLVNPTGDVAYADDQGRFSAEVPSPGFYELQAHHSDWGGGAAQVTAPADGVELLLEPKAGLRVTVELREGAGSRAPTSCSGSGATGRIAAIGRRVRMAWC